LSKCHVGVWPSFQPDFDPARLAKSDAPADRGGRAPRSGRGGRRFKSCHSNQHLEEIKTFTGTDWRHRFERSIGSGANPHGRRCPKVGRLADCERDTAAHVRVATHPRFPSWCCAMQEPNRASDYESGGREFESLRARQQIAVTAEQLSKVASSPLRPMISNRHRVATRSE
jgi:hypothetical protein